MCEIVLRLLCGAALIVSLACETDPSSKDMSSKDMAVVYAQAGQTVKEAVDSLPPTGGTVVLGVGVWSSGYTTNFITKPNITIQGSGRPGYNSAYTAMSGGTIVQGNLSASTGADYFAVEDLGVDAGPAYINAHNGGVATDALAIFNSGQILGAPPVESPRIENVACLGYSPTAAAHCMLVENVNHASIGNVVTVMNQHGLVLKGTNSTVTGVYARGHGTSSISVKSDNYAPASNDQLFSVTIEPLVAPGDTKGIVVAGIDAPVSDIGVSEALIRSPLAWGILVQGASSATPATALNFSNITVEYDGRSPTSEYCMQFVQYVSNVNINHLSCSNMWAGIAPYLPVSGAFTDFNLSNSVLTNIATNGVETYGQWNISDTSFESIAGNGIVADFGVTTVSGDTFTNIGGSNMSSAGGSFVVLAP
jgi:hypothetical protein